MSQLRLVTVIFGCIVCVVVFGQIVIAQESLPNPNAQKSLPLLGALDPPRRTTRQAPQDSTIDDWLNGKFSPEAYKLNKDDDDETRLKKQRINAALMETGHYKRLNDAGVETLDTAIESQQRLLAAQLDLHTNPQMIVSVLQQALKAAKQTEAVVKGRFNEGADVNIQQVGQATYHKLDVEIKLLHAQKK